MQLFVKSFLVLGLFFVNITARAAFAQTLDLPAQGLYNGFLRQSNVVECENGGTSSLNIILKLRRSDGTVRTQTQFTLPPFGAKHISLNNLANIDNTYGTYSIQLTNNATTVSHLSCRTMFYRFTPGSSNTALDFAYALPLRNPQSGVLSGVYNSINPSRLSSPVTNWLSIVNLSSSAFQARVRLYNQSGNLYRTIRITNLLPRQRFDVPLGHPLGQTTGLYRIEPDNLSQSFDAYLIRYSEYTPTQYNFALALRATAADCTPKTLFLSTMANGHTKNWLELANAGNVAVNARVQIRNVLGAILREETRLIPRRSQSHIYINSVIDPGQTGKVGSATISCLDPSNQLLAQTAFYGQLPNSTLVQWAYATRAQDLARASSSQQLVFPINTNLAMANWQKVAGGDRNASPNVTFSVLNDSGSTLTRDQVQVPRGGTSDLDLHTRRGRNGIGTAISTPATSSIVSELLRVIPRRAGGIEAIIYISGSRQPKVTLPAPSSGYFPPSAVWYRDVSNAAVDPESDEVISWLESVGGWGSGVMRIDNSIEVLTANSTTPFRSFVPTDDFYEPDCDYTQVPVPLVGAIEGETGYRCFSDGDCHLIVAHQPSRRLFEMWRANIVGSTFYGGCLAVWDMTRVYGPSGRGENCTSADGAGFPIAPLLFTADEVARGSVNHALRFILPNARIREQIYVHPATHSTGATSGPASAPPYGAHFRLRADFPLSSLPNNAARVIARAMQRYGMFLADGGTIALTGQSDRYSNAKWDNLMSTYDLSSIRVSDFEMVDGGERFSYSGDCDREP